MTLKSSSPGPVTPKIIIHGGAGAITHTNLPPALYASHRHALLSALHSTSHLVTHGASALHAATHAVTLLESNPLFNAGRGAVFTSSGSLELEASVMVSCASRKRGVGVSGLKGVRHPVLLAREMLVRGEGDDGGGSGGHVQIFGREAEELARSWEVERCLPSANWTKKRWDQHRVGLGLGTERGDYERGKREADEEWEKDGGMAVNIDGGLEGKGGEEVDDPDWDGREYVPQGTVGAVILDSFGTICVATSTGGITNKLPGRIGDTPTLGAGFWAEQWIEENPFDRPHGLSAPLQQLPASPLARLLGGPSLGSVFTDCLPDLSSYLPLSQADSSPDEKILTSQHGTLSAHHAVAMSGTGNGDSFLRLAAVRTAAAMARFSFPPLPLQWCVTRMAGPEGMLQQSAGERWHKTGEGEGGIIGIEFKAGKGTVVADFNCGGMFRVWFDDEGKERMMVFRDEY